MSCRRRCRSCTCRCTRSSAAGRPCSSARRRNRQGTRSEAALLRRSAVDLPRCSRRGAFGGRSDRPGFSRCSAAYRIAPPATRPDTRRPSAKLRSACTRIRRDRSEDRSARKPRGLRTPRRSDSDRDRHRWCSNARLGDSPRSSGTRCRSSLSRVRRSTCGRERPLSDRAFPLCSRSRASSDRGRTRNKSRGSSRTRTRRRVQRWRWSLWKHQGQRTRRDAEARRRAGRRVGTPAASAAAPLARTRRRRRRRKPGPAGRDAHRPDGSRAPATTPL